MDSCALPARLLRPTHGSLEGGGCVRVCVCSRVSDVFDPSYVVQMQFLAEASASPEAFKQALRDELTKMFSYAQAGGLEDLASA